MASVTLSKQNVAILTHVILDQNERLLYKPPTALLAM
jgi:hypothetical protein